jgi:glycosyltransferase involved in cell wall biosynthesis
MQRILEDGKSGYVVADATPRGLANRIEKIISNSANPLLSAHAIRASVLKYGWSNVASAVVNEYDTVLRDSLSELTRTPSAFASSG